MLFNATLIVDLVALATTLWGAFYLFARGFPSWITLRAVIVLLFLSIFFLGAYNNLFYYQVAGFAAWRAVLLICSFITWYSLTYRLMAPPEKQRLRRMQIFIYVLGGVAVVSLLVTPDAFTNEQGNKLYVAQMRFGLPYILYGLFQCIASFGILYNLLTGNRIGLTRQGKYFFVASIFPVLAIVLSVVGLAATPQLPRVVPDLLILSAVVLLGISVARHQSLVERRTTIQDLPLSVFTVLGLAVLYSHFALQWGLSLEKIGAVVAFAVLTHSIYDLVHEVLGRQQRRHESTFRRQLRQLDDQISGEEALQLRLQDGLDLLCKTLNTAGGFIAVRRGENFVVAASNDSVIMGSQLSPEVVACDDITRFKGDQLSAVDWLAPAFEGPTQVAVIGLNKPRAKLDYSTGDLDLLAEVSDQIGTIISISNHTARHDNQIQQLVAESQAHTSEINSIADDMIVTMSVNSNADFIRFVEEGLRHVSDYISLGQSPLVSQLNITGTSLIECGKQLQQILIDAIESLRPAEKRPPEPLPRVWYNYVVLHDAYVEGVPNREIMARLYISEGTFNRTRRSALRGLARLIIEKSRL